MKDKIEKEQQVLLLPVTSKKEKGLNDLIPDETNKKVPVDMKKSYMI